MSDNRYTVATWEEKVVDGPEDGPRFAHVHATFEYSGVLEGTSVCDYLLYYAGQGYDGAGQTAPGYERFKGSLGGREGSFVLRHEVAYAGHDVTDRWTVVPGSATGELTGLSGSGTATASQDRTMSYTFDYSL